MVEATAGKIFSFHLLSYRFNGSLVDVINNRTGKHRALYRYCHLSDNTRRCIL